MNWSLLQAASGARVANGLDSFWEKLAIAAVGPGITVLVGSLAVGLFVTWFTDRARRRQADLEVREQMILEMTRIASTLYFELLYFRRSRSSVTPAVMGWRPGWLSFSSAESARSVAAVAQKQLDEHYRTFRVASETLEKRLACYFADEGPRREWHAVSDLLTVRYYESIDELTDAVIENNAGNDHSGLSCDQLRIPKEVAKAYKARLQNAARQVMAAPRFSSAPDKWGEDAAEGPARGQRDLETAKGDGYRGERPGGES